MVRKIILSVMVVVLACGLMVACTAYWLVGKILEAEGHAFYSGSGAWSRILEYAEETGNDKYVQEAQESVSMFQDGIADWKEVAPLFFLDPEDFKSDQTEAYEVTDSSIKNGENPLAYLDEEFTDAP